MLLQRPASMWSFWLISAHPSSPSNPPQWQGVDIMFKKDTAGNALSVWWTNQSQRQIACITSPNSSTSLLNNNNAPPPIHCILRTHATQFIHTILKPWNPHAILLTLCCMQLLICVSKTQHSRELKQELGSIPKNRDLHVPLGYALGLLGILITVILILTGLKDSTLVEYPTILAILLLFEECARYCWNFSQHADDGRWNLAFHMQLVSVPLAVLSITTMGARLWTDVLTHIVLLSAAVNCLWLQTSLSRPWSVQLCRLVTIFLPTLSISLAHMQWGSPNDGSRYAIALMGCAGLLPLYIFTVLLVDAGRGDKIKLRMAHLCTAAALLSLVTNLAVFN